MYVLAEALKKLRVVDAKLNPEEFNCIKELYRGMADMQVDAEMIQRLGGTELAPVCALSCSVLHCVALCCTVLQCVAVWCSVLQRERERPQEDLQLCLVSTRH